MSPDQALGYGGPVRTNPPMYTSERQEHMSEAMPSTPNIPDTGAPAAAVPTGLDGTLPIGIQLIGPRWQDATVLAAARVIETAVVAAATP